MTVTERVERRATDELLQELLDVLGRLPNGLRQMVAERQWAEIPLTVDEYGWSDAQPANTPLAVSAQTSNLELIECVVGCVPTGATGFVQLGLMKLYLPSGITVLPKVRKLLSPTDARTIVVSGAGPTALWLSGVQMPTTGILAK